MFWRPTRNGHRGHDVELRYQHLIGPAWRPTPPHIRLEPKPRRSAFDREQRARRRLLVKSLLVMAVAWLAGFTSGWWLRGLL